MIFNTVYNPNPESSRLEDIIYKEAEEKAMRIRQKIMQFKGKQPRLITNDPNEIREEKEFFRKIEIVLPDKPVYYYNPRKNKASFSYSTNGYSYGNGTIIKKVPQAVLGANVLGRAFPGLNYVEILESLNGNDYEEVKRHELNHINYPHLSEYDVRERTRQELPFAPRYH